MAYVPDNTLEGEKAEISRLIEVIARIESGEFRGPLKHEVLDILREALALHRVAAFELEAMSGIRRHH